MAEDGQLLVGRAGKGRMIADPASGQAFFKRHMGTAASYRFGGKTRDPITCSAEVLAEMKRVAEFQLGAEVTKAVIIVPAYFLFRRGEPSRRRGPYRGAVPCRWREEKDGWRPDAAQTGSWRQPVKVAKRMLAANEVTNISVDGKTIEVTREQLVKSSAAITARLRPVVTR